MLEVMDMETTLGKIVKLKKYLIGFGILAFVCVYIGFLYLVFFADSTEIGTHTGTISFGSGTALGWFLTLTAGIVILLIGYLHGKYQLHKESNPQKYL
jgi:hypothetical protein